MKPSELISVIMGVRYRRENLNLLKRSIKSITNQTYKNIEFIICEYDSTESAKEYLKEISFQDDRIKLIDGSGMKFLSEKLNACFHVSSGQWIARMDDDDFSAPKRLEMQLDFLKKHNDISFVGCNVKLIQNGKAIGFRSFPEYPNVRDFLFNMPFIHPTLMFRKSALASVGGYSELTRCNKCEDYDLLLRMYEKGLCGANIKNVVFSYTLPSNGAAKRSLLDRMNETRTRFVRYSALGLMPMALPYAVKPILVWLIPNKILSKLKEKLNITVRGQRHV